MKKINTKRFTEKALKFDFYKSRNYDELFDNVPSEFDELFPKVKLQHFKDLPIKISPDDLFTEIAMVVAKIELEKCNDANFISNELESQIDQLVYKLYDLSEEEIKIIENN